MQEVFLKRARYTVSLFLVSAMFIAPLMEITSSGISISFKKANAATFTMQTGYYFGTGADDLAISGLGITPDLVIIKDDTSAGSDGANFKISTMSGETSSVLGDPDADDASNAIQSLDSGGFTVGTNNDTNNQNFRYTYIAFDGSDCTSSGTFCVGSYTGNGTSQSLTSVGFQPDLVVIKRSGATNAVFKTSSMGTDVTQFFAATNEIASGTNTHIQTLDSTGFTVGSDAAVNTNSNTYWYFAFKEVSGAMDVGTYTGDGSDNRSLTGPGFLPDWVFTKNANATTPVSANYNVTESYGDYSSLFTDTINAVDLIQSLDTDGFTVGASAGANENTKTFYYAAFGGAVDPVASGTFSMMTGSYSGTGSGQSITGLGFAPDLVMIKHTDQATDQYAVFRTRTLWGDSTLYFAEALTAFTGGITSLDSDGFTIGTHATVNTSGDTYYWQAFGNAFDPYTNTGAADFLIGVYTGNGLDSRDITRLPFQPDLVTIKRSSSGNFAATWRSSDLSGDNTGQFSAGAEVANRIQAINSDGFEIGDNNGVNAANSDNQYFAFKEGTNFVANSYTGTGASQDITTVGFQPDLLWVKRTTAVAGVLKPSTISTVDSAQYFINSPNAAGIITNLLSNGFTVTTATETNTNTGSYRYLAWHARKYDQRVYRFFANADSTDVGSALAASNTAVTLSSAGVRFRLRMLLRNDGGRLYASAQSFKLQYVDRGTGTCASPAGGTPSSYTDVTTSTKIAFSGNPTPADGDALTANANDPIDAARTIVNQDYEELNNQTNSEAAIASGEDGKWDFSLQDLTGSAGATYCFRMVKSDGTVLDTYTVYPEVTIPAYLSFDISSNIVDFGSLSSTDARWATSGASSGGSSTDIAGHTFSIDTNAGSGYSFSYQATSTLTSGLNTIGTPPMTDTNDANGDPGTEQFLLGYSSNRGATTVNPEYAHGAIANLRDWKFVTGNVESIITSTTQTTSTETVDAYYLANISSNTESSTYTTSITYIISGNF